MVIYTLRRLLETVPTLLGIAIVVFFFVRALPGDPARLYAGQEASAQEVAQVQERFGLDRSLPEQFGLFLTNLVQGDLGRSFRANQPVSQMLGRYFVPTLYLSLTAITLATLVGVALGIFAAVRRDSLADLSVTSLSILGISTPSFFLGLLLIYVFAVGLRVLPVAGSVSLSGLVLPTLTLAAGSIGTIARFTRSSLLEVLGEDYVRTARAKGLPQHRIINKHALRNALIPVVTVIGLQFGFLLSGAIIVETIFTFPGLGWLLIQSIDARDYPVIQALLLVFSVQFVIINLLVDLLYATIDPRVSYD